MDRTPQLAGSWRIVNDQGEFWNNNTGWGDFSTATAFTGLERLIWRLPLGGSWQAQIDPPLSLTMSDSAEDPHAARV